MIENHDQIDELTKTIRKANQLQGLWPTFLRGMVGGLGATLGVGIVLGLVGFLLQQLAVVPVLKNSIESVLPKIQEKAITIPTDEEIDLPIKQASTPTPPPTPTPTIKK